MGTALLIVGGFACAMTPNIEFLILARIVQGLGAGAAAVAVPSLIRKRAGEIESVKAIGAVASIEAIVPALGPVLGAGLIALSNWRLSFALLAGVTVLLVPFIWRLMGSFKPSARRSEQAPYLSLFKNVGFMRYALSYSIMFAALILMVMTAPQIIVHWFKLEVYYFSIMQVAGVTAFILLVRRGGVWAENYGIARVIQIGAFLQITSCVGLVILASCEMKSFTIFALLWSLFGAGLALRGPSTMTRALSHAQEIAGKASGLLMFFAFGLCSAATTWMAQYLSDGLFPVAATLTAMILASIALVPRHPKSAE